MKVKANVGGAALLCLMLVVITGCDLFWPAGPDLVTVVPQSGAEPSEIDRPAIALYAEQLSEIPGHRRGARRTLETAEHDVKRARVFSG